MQHSLLSALTLTTCLVVPTVASADCLFVNNNAPINSVTAFTAHGDGTLTTVAGSPFATGGSGEGVPAFGGAAVCPNRNLVYVTNAISGNLSGFAVAPGCELVPVPGSPFAVGTQPTSVDADPSCEHLIVTNFGDDSISVFDIAADGSLTPVGGSPFAVAGGPLDLTIAPSGGRLFVSQNHVDAVGVYDVAADGTITAVAGSPFSAAGSELALDIDSAASRLYIAEAAVAPPLSGFSIGAGGTLAPLPGSPYPTGGQGPFGLLVSPADSVVYATSNGFDSISAFAIGGDGSLSPVAGSPFASGAEGPADLVANPAGTILYLAHGGFFLASPFVSAYTIAPDGSLAQLPGSPFPTQGTGAASGIAYLETAGDEVTSIPTLGTFGLAVLTLLLLLAGVSRLRILGMRDQVGK